MAIWAFLRKSIEKPCFCPFWRILGIGTFFIWGGLWAVPRQKMDSKKASCSKRSQKHDLAHESLSSPLQNIPVAPKRAKIGGKGVQKGVFPPIWVQWVAKQIFGEQTSAQKRLRRQNWTGLTTRKKLQNLTPDLTLLGRNSLEIALFSLQLPSSQKLRFRKGHSSLKMGLFWLKFDLGPSEGKTGRSHKFQIKRSGSKRYGEGSKWQFGPF